MRKLRVMVLVREGLEPPETLDGVDDKELAKWKAEFDVISTLRYIGHDVQPVGVYDDLSPIRRTILEWKPHIAFMLLEEFHGVGTYDQAIVSYLELMRLPYTGCNPRGMLLSRDKALAKKVLAYHHIPTPRFSVVPLGKACKRTKRLTYPLLVKSAMEDASLGISQASIVRDDQALAERVKFVHDKVGSDAIVEQYIEGRELYVGVIGNLRLQTLPVWEMVFSKMPEDVAPIATARVKFDEAYQKKYGISTRKAGGVDAATAARIAKTCKRVFHVLAMSGYARMDLRMREDGRVFVLEANANPNLEFGEDFAESAEAEGISYEALLQRIINLGLRYHAPWKQ
jgi:D-alanine-D-alanine ligase